MITSHDTGLSSPPPPSASAAARRRWLSALAASCAHDPLKFVRVAYPWQEAGGPLEHERGPDGWQADVLAALREELGKGKPIRFAVAGGVGPGKSALMAWIVDWGMTTMLNTRCRVTANTGPQLSTATWPEIAKWRAMSLWRDWFEPGDRRIRSSDPGRRETWRADAITWDEHRPEAFRGFHNAGSRIIYAFDEASGIPHPIFEASEGILSGAHDTEVIWLCLGNPTRTTTDFRTFFPGGKNAHLWRHWHIDTRTARKANKTQIQEWIDEYGLDHDYVRVNVLSQFPDQGDLQFISNTAVTGAADPKRDVPIDYNEALIVGVDVAWQGSDQSVVRFRRGLDARSVKPYKFRGMGPYELAEKIAEIHKQHKPDAIFVDRGTFGGAVVERLNMMRLPVHGIDFGGAPIRTMQSAESGVACFNRRAEMWQRMKDWLPFGAIDHDAKLIADLTAVQYGHRIKQGRDCILLEAKKDMRKRGLASPDDGDSLALTFAAPIARMDDRFRHAAANNQFESHYDPLRY